MLCNLCRDIKFKPYLELAKDEKLYLLSYCEEWSPGEPGHYTEEEVLDNDFGLIGGSDMSFYFHHRNLELLQESANNGCDFCILLFFGLPETKNVVQSIEDDYDRVYLVLHVPDSTASDWEHLEYGDLDVRFGQEGLGSLRMKIADDYKEFVPSSQDLEKNSTSGSITNLDLAASWFRDCANNHKHCHHQPQLASILPYRVLDLGTGDSSQKIKLSVGEHRIGSYAALSYCWGKSGSQCNHLDSQCNHLTLKNMDQRQRFVDESTFPRTFTDAIVVCRHLGIRYLWIDSLCIVQDCKIDWQTQSGRMGDIYSDASLTISAALGEDSHAGLFFERDPRTTQPCTLDIQFPKEDGVITRETFLVCHDWYMPEPAYLDERGWTFQEKYLSRRTLRFSQEGISWTCASRTASEGLPMGLIPLNNKSDFDRYIRTDAAGGPSHQLDISQRLRWWYHTTEIYSRRIFTRESDRLMALTGLAAKFQMPADEFLCGLWRSDLANGLAWIVCEEMEGYIPDANFKSTAPSWSWASRPGRLITYDEEGIGGKLTDCNFSLVAGAGKPTSLPVTPTTSDPGKPEFLPVTFFEVLSDITSPLLTHVPISPVSCSLEIRGLLQTITPEESSLANYADHHRNLKPFWAIRGPYSKESKTWKRFLANAFYDEPVARADLLYCLPLRLFRSSYHEDLEEPCKGSSIGKSVSSRNSRLSTEEDILPGMTWCAGHLSSCTLKKSDALSCLILKRVDTGVKYRRVGYMVAMSVGCLFDGVSPTVLEII